MAPLAWRICDLNGATLASIVNRVEDKVTIPLCDQRTGTLKLSADDPAARLVAPLGRVLKCTMGSNVLLCGEITDPIFDGQARTVEIPVVDIVADRLHTPLEPPAPADSPYVLSLPNTDQAQIMWSLVQAARPSSGDLAAGVLDLGVIAGSLPATVWRDRFYEPGQVIWDAIVELSQVQGGLDFDLAPLDRADGIFAALNTYTRMGADKTGSVVFHFNWGTDNCENLAYKPLGSSVTNRAIDSGQSELGTPPPYYRSDQIDSQKAYGLRRQMTGHPDISDTTALKSYAQSTAATLAFPPDFFEVTPAVEGLGAIDKTTGQRVKINPQTGSRYGVPPVCAPDGDYWLGDTITAVGVLDSKGALRVELEGRVTQIELSSQGQAGDVRAVLTCAPDLPSYPVT